VALASGGQATGGRPRTVATIERRLSALAWNFAQRALPFDRKDRHVATVLAGVRRTHGRPPVEKEALLPEHVVAMLDALLLSDLGSPRDRAILLLGFAAGLRRWEIVGHVMSREDSLESSGWPEFFDGGVLLTLRGKTGWREVEIGRGSSERTCPVTALEAHPPPRRRLARAHRHRPRRGGAPPRRSSRPAGAG
jgi:integrase